MIVFSLMLLAIGIFLSAFFSGIETGFYRASRVRIVMAGLDGDRVSQRLLKLINNPSWFVATTLIGNNVANYLTSLAIVLFTKTVSHSSAAEMLAPILLSPMLFVYGELLPKNLFFQAPNLLLRSCAPLFLFFTIVFAPAVAVMWTMGQIMERWIGQSPEKIRLALARKELQQVLEEGLEAGILLPTQRHLAQNFFLNASRPVSDFCAPPARIPGIPANSSAKAALKLARQKRLEDIPVFENDGNRVIGYVRTIDLLLNQGNSNKLEGIRGLMEISSNELFAEAVLQMQAARAHLAKVVDPNGVFIGVLSIDHLTNPLLVGSLGSLRR